VRRFRECPRPEQYVSSAVPLIYEAAFSYFDLLFGGREKALADLTLWTKRPSSEYSILRATGLVHGEICPGIIIGIGGDERNHCHKADVLALNKSAAFRKRSPLLLLLDTLRLVAPGSYGCLLHPHGECGALVARPGLGQAAGPDGN
jgi:hypothetical protein